MPASTVTQANIGVTKHHLAKRNVIFSTKQRHMSYNHNCGSSLEPPICVWRDYGPTSKGRDRHTHESVFVSWEAFITWLMGNP